jgi:GNAT superfamily N-acetyltransferase
MFQITAAQPDEAAIVHHIMQEAFAEYRDILQPPSGSHAETVADVQRAIVEGGAVLVWDGDVPVASARYRREPDHLYVGRVAVLPAYRRRGIASLVMRWMEEQARRWNKSSVRVGVRMSLPGNLALYEKLGYRMVEVQPHPRGPDRVATLVKQLDMSDEP